jgi:hypothetical protein
MNRSRLLPLLATLLLSCAAAGQAQAQAQAASAPETLPPVSVELKRNPDVLPYARINELLGKLDRYGESLFRMDFAIDTAKTQVPISAVRMAVRSDEADHPIAIDAEGRFKLPVLSSEEAKTADLSTNRPKGQISIQGTIELNTRVEDLDMAKVRQITRVGQTLRSELLPWYLRLLFPQIDGVRVCSREPRWELEWRDDGGQLLGLPLSAAPKEKDPTVRAKAPAGDARVCTLLTGLERYPDRARMLAPADATLSVKLRD